MLDLKKDCVHIFDISTLEINDTILEYDCEIPENLPDAAKILSASISILSNSIELTGENTIIKFKLAYNILYSSESNNDITKSKKYNIKSFTSYYDSSILSNNTYKADCIITPIFNIEDTNFNLLNKRKIALSSKINVKLNIKEIMEEYFCNDISGLEDIQIQNEALQIINSGETISESVDLAEGIELSASKAPFKEILRSYGSINNITSSIDSDYLNIKGILNICTLYMADDYEESLQIIENEINFSHSIPINTDDNIKWQTNLSLNNFDVAIIQDSDNENRILQITGKININVCSYVILDVQTIKDAYSLSKDLSIKKRSITCFTSVENVNTQFILRETVYIPEDAPRIEQIININGSFCNYNIVTNDEEITLTGNISYNILYISSENENKISSLNIVKPFSQKIDSVLLDKNIKSILELFINHISFNIMSANEIEIRVSLSAKGLQLKSETFEIIDEAEACDLIVDEASKPSILLYVVQANDTLWTVAKRYNAPIELLKEINHINTENNILAGQKLLIPV